MSAKHPTQTIPKIVNLVVAGLLAASSFPAPVTGSELPAGNTDWNQWRGPNRNGLAPNGPKLADEWGPDGPVQLWKSEEKIPGGPKKGGSFSNYGSPVVAKGKVYLFVHDQAAAADVVFCLDASTGKTLWKTSYPGLPNGGASCTPYVGGGKVYAVGSSGMYCLDADTGREIWKTPSIGDEVNSSPAIVDGVFVVCAGSGKHLNLNAKNTEKESGLFKGFDPATGKELWSCPEATSDPNRNGDKSSSVAVWNTDKGPRLITQTGKLTCVNPKDGSVIWQDNDIHMGPGTPAIVGDVCITAGKVRGYSLRPDNAEKLFGREESDRCGSYILHDGHVYGDFAGSYRCIDLTGKILWQKSAGYGISSPVLADGKIFHIVSGKGESKVKLAMFSATPTMPATFYEVSVPALHFTSPAICGGRLFIRLQDGVACYDLTKAPADVAKAIAEPVAAIDPVTATAPKAKALISFVDVSPSYKVMRKAIAEQTWPPEIEAEAAVLDWAVNKELSADGTIDFIELQDARGMPTRDVIAYVRIVLEAAAPGKLALSLSVPECPADPHGLVVWVNGATVLRHDVAHGRVKEQEELVVNLVTGKNILLVRTNNSIPEKWKLQVQAKALDGLVVKQVAAAPAGATGAKKAKP